MTPRRWLLVAAVAGFLVLLFLVWVAQNAASRKNETTGFWQDKISQIRSLTREGRVIPSTELLKNLEGQRIRFQEKLNALLDSVKRKQEVPAYESPLAFKGDLFKIQRGILSRAQGLSIGMPPDIGFKDFIGKEIPPAADLSKLSFQLAKIKEFLNLAMDCEIAEVKEIQRCPAVFRRVEPSEKTPFFQGFSFKVHFLCSPGAFRKFLTQLLASGSIFVIENLEVRLQSEKTLDVQATIQAVVFTDEKGAPARS